MSITPSPGEMCATNKQLHYFVLIVVSKTLLKNGQELITGLKIPEKDKKYVQVSRHHANSIAELKL